MAELSLDGNISFIGTEFIKSLNTGSSDLATVAYVDEQVALGGGEGGGNGNGDGYTQAEVDALLNNKLNVNNPQDIIGNLRLDSTNGNSKLIINAVSPPNASDDFYCNGNAHINGTLRVSVLTSDGDVNAQGVNADTFNSNVITNDIVFKHDDNEYMRFQVSDNTVRVPNTKSFLSQNIFTDDIKPLAFANDVVFNGGNSTNDAYEEFMRLDASAEKVSISKETKFENDVQLNVGQVIKFTNVFIREVQGTTRPEFDLIINGSTSHMRMWVAGAIRQAITNTAIACKVNIDAEQGLTVFTGKELKTNTINSHTNSNLVIQRSGSTYMTFQSNRIDIDQPLHLANSLTIDLADKLTLKPSLEGGVNIFDIRNLHPVVDNPMIRFRVGNGTGETIVCEMTNNGVSFQRNVIVGTAYELRTNAIDTTTDNDLVISRNNIPFLTLDKFTEDTVEREAIICSKQLRANGNVLVNNLQINQFQSGVEYADFRLHNADSVLRFFVGNSTNPNFQITNANINLNRETTIGSAKTNTINSNGNNTLTIQQNGNPFISLLGDALNRVQVNRFLRVVDGGESTQAQFVNNSNGNYMEFRLGNHINAYASGTPVNGNTLHLNYYSHGDVMLGTNQDTGADPIPTISINKFTSNTGNAFEVQGNSVFSGSVSTNTLNSETGDLVFQRLGTEMFKCETSAGIDNNDIINVTPSGGGMSAVNVYCNSFKNRTLTSDTVFYGANSAGDNRIEYMKWNRTDQSLDFNAPIDNTNISIIGNIIDTTISDERLKTNIQDVESNFTECVKNVKVKTFEYKDEKYKDSDKYGMIAQDLLAHLPKECKNIVKETKPKKDKGEAYLSINYMKLSVVLWKCCQEQQSKIEHLEASMYEMMEEIKELKSDKTGKGKAKAKPKSKAKTKNVD